MKSIESHVSLVKGNEISSVCIARGYRDPALVSVWELLEGVVEEG